MDALTGINEAAVLVIDSATERRERLVAQLRARGALVESASRVAEVERWPTGDVVVKYSQFTPFWKTSGARHVVVLASTREEGLEACRE